MLDGRGGRGGFSVGSVMKGTAVPSPVASVFCMKEEAEYADVKEDAGVGRGVREQESKLLLW